jgi:hypothetical protein
MVETHRLLNKKQVQSYDLKNKKNKEKSSIKFDL